MNDKELMNLTVKEICNYISCMNQLVEAGIIKFNKEKAYVEFSVDDTIVHLEKQNVQLKKDLENAQNVSKADHRYASEKEDEVIVLQTQQREFLNYLRELSNWYHFDGVKQGIVNDILSEYKGIIDKG